MTSSARIGTTGVQNSRTARDIESAGQHADHSVTLIVQRDGVPMTAGIGAEARHPRTVTEESDPWRVWHVVIGTERPAQRGRGTQRIEESAVTPASDTRWLAPRSLSHAGHVVDPMAAI